MGSGGGVGLAALVFLVFLVLKLTHVISWGWWLVTLPLWGGLAIALTIGLVAVVIYGATLLVKRARS